MRDPVARGVARSGSLPRLGLPAGGSPVLIGVAIGAIGLLGYSLIYFFGKGSSEPIAQSSPDSEIVEVFIPQERVEAGTELKPTMFRAESRIVASIPPSAIRSVDQFRGAYAASYMPAGQPVVAEYVTTQPPGGLIEAELGDGYRAVSVSVDSTTGVEGWARPGAKVDVLLASTVHGKPALTVILQNLEVLSAGRSALGSLGASEVAAVSHVNLRVRSEDAAKLQLAAASGALSLALRGDEDNSQTSANETILIDNLLGVGSAAPPPAPVEGRVTIDGRQYTVRQGKLVAEDTTGR